MGGQRDIAKFEAVRTLDEAVAAFSRKSKKREPWVGKFARRLLQRRGSNAVNDNLIGALEDDGKEEEHEKCKKKGKKRKQHKMKRQKKKRRAKDIWYN